MTAARAPSSGGRNGGDSVHVILMTAPTVAAAASLVRALVDERLAACGNIVAGVTSIYRWQGEVHTDPEAMVVLKVAAERLPALLARATELHPYDVPEILVLPVLAGHEPYLAWVRESCAPTEAVHIDGMAQPNHEQAPSG